MEPEHAETELPWTVVAGVDGRPGGADAAALAAALAGPGAEVLLAGVYRDPRLHLPLAFGRDDDPRADAERVLREVRDAHAPGARLEVVCDGFPARALRRLAEREEAGLLVLGSTHRAAPGDAAIGRRARQALHDATCPVALAARGVADAPGRPRRIVVGIDGSLESEAALALASRLAGGDDARVIVVAVADDALPTTAMPFGAPLELGRWEEVVQQRRVRAERLVERATAGARCGAQVLVGDPADQLARAAAAADLLVIGSRRWGRLARVVVGSTAEGLLRRAPCSLVLVPRPAQAPSAGEGDAGPADEARPAAAPSEQSGA